MSAVEPVVALAGEGDVAAIEVGDRLLRVAIELFKRGDAVLGRILAVVVPVVERRRIPLIVRRHDAAAERRLPSGAMVDLGDGVELRQVLRGIVDILDDAEIRLQDGLGVLEFRVEAELVRDGRFAGCDVVAGRDVNLVEDVVVEVELVRSNPRFLEWVDAEGGDQRLRPVRLSNKRIDISGVGRVVERDEWRVHVTGRAGCGRSSQQDSRCRDERKCPVQLPCHTFLLDVVDQWVPRSWVESSSASDGKSVALRRSALFSQRLASRRCPSAP